MFPLMFARSPLHLRVLAHRGAPVALSVLLLALAPPTARAQDVTGTWLLRVDLGSGGAGRVTLVLEQEGSAVSGTYSGSYGNLVELSGAAEGGRVQLAFPNERLGEITYEGEVVADTMWGSVTYGSRFDGTFEAFRRPPATIVSTLVGYGVLALVVLLAMAAIARSLR